MTTFIRTLRGQTVTVIRDAGSLCVTLNVQETPQGVWRSVVLGPEEVAKLRKTLGVPRARARRV